MKLQPGEPVLVCVEWEDAYNGDHGWTMEDEIPDASAPMIVRTMGHLLRAQQGRITLAMSRAEFGDDGSAKVQFCDLFTIPRGCIRRIVVLGDSVNGPNATPLR